MAVEATNYKDLAIIITPILVFLGGIITTYITHISKVKLNKNSLEFTDNIKLLNSKLDDLSKDVTELKVDVKDRSTTLSIYKEVSGALANSLIYSNDQKLSDFATAIADQFIMFIDGIVLSKFEAQDDSFMISRLNNFRLKAFSYNNDCSIDRQLMDIFKEVTLTDFSNFETQLIKLQKDTINNKKHRFGLLSITFIQDVLSLVIRTYSKKK